jgi:hypothetical protein
VQELTAACEGALPGKDGEALEEALQGVADAVFDADRVESGGRPCEALRAFLTSHGCTVPELPAPPAPAPAAPRPAPAAVPSATAPPPAGPAGEPEVLFELTFSHGPGASKDHLGKAYLALLIHQRGLPPEQAQAQVHAQALIGFDKSIEKVLEGYEGPVCFRLIRHPDGVRPELRRLAAGGGGHASPPARAAAAAG